ncbi:MAG: hypothetical protein BroJett040_22760 [Oligoflexia bacterium]|nr:MAG: hypothetical protein BroJett040_22760 [Oligoflexia bacterium]
MSDDSIVKEFVIECLEGLSQLDVDFVTLETAPDDNQILSRIFRNIHSVKGAAGFLAFQKLEALAHAGENVLGRLRDGNLKLTAERTTVLLAMVDAIREMLNQIDQTGKEGDGDYSALVHQLKEIYQVKEDTVIPAPLNAPAVNVESVEKTIAQAQATAVDSNIRVNVEVLDKLMNLVGELVLVRNQLCQSPEKNEDPQLGASYQRLNAITSELQEGIMKTRMQPVDNIFGKFPRIVRDLSSACGKKVHLEVSGRETELDRSVIEAIRDPLTHLIRNAIDHGIEKPDQRIAKGKSQEGTLQLKAYHEGGLVNIDIIDDGNGIDPDRVKNKAIEKGIVSSEEAEKMSELEAVRLIFKPGFSTAEQITNVSGRGVGMDVVKSNIENIGGLVEIDTVLGKGSAFKIKIPLTLAIIPAMIVRSHQNRFAIPMSSLVELLRVEKGQSIEMVHGAPVYRLRGQLLPLLYLDKELKLTQDVSFSKATNIVVLLVGDRHFGLVVDQIHDTQEVVVKPMGKQLKSVNVFSGATILGDGRVCLILDVINLAKRSQIVSEAAQRVERSGQNSHDVLSQEQMLVIAQSPGNGRLAIPFEYVARLEKFERTKTEKLGDRTVIQYRGKILPLISLTEILPERRSPERLEMAGGLPPDPELMDVVVFHHQKGSVGVVVDRIIDIVEQEVKDMSPSSRAGAKGCFILNDRVTEILDVDFIVDRGSLGAKGEVAI